MDSCNQEAARAGCLQVQLVLGVQRASPRPSFSFPISWFCPRITTANSGKLTPSAAPADCGRALGHAPVSP